MLRDRSTLLARTLSCAALPIVATLLAGSVAAQTAWRFDMGPGSLAIPYIRVEANDEFPQSAAGTPNYGWISTPSSNRVEADADIPEEVIHAQSSRLLRDHVKDTGGPLTFGLGVSPGTYHITVYLGDVSAPIEGMKITANTRVVADGIFARTVNQKASLEGALGGFKRVCFKFDAPTAIAPGVPRLRLKFEGSAGQACPVMGIEVRPYTPEPLYFDHASKDLAANVTPSTELAQAIAKYNTHDYDEAVTLFRSAGANHPSEKLAMCYGFAFVLGSLTEHMNAVDTALLDEMVDELELLDANNSAVHNLLVDAQDFELAELFDRTRGYTFEAFEENEQNLVDVSPSGVPTWITLNLCAAVQLYEQMRDDTFLTTPSPYATECPLFPKARYLIARNMWGRNTLVSAGNTNGLTQSCDLAFVEYNKYWYGIIRDELLTSLTGSSPLYPKGHEAMVVCFLLDHYLKNQVLDDASPDEPCTKYFKDGLIGQWIFDSERPDAPVQPQDAWWGQYSNVQDTAAEGGERWARDLRAHTRQFRNLARWWIQERLRENPVTKISEFGGGSGDDQELTVLSTPGIALSESPDNPNVEGPLNSVWDAYLYHEDQVSVEEGYFKLAGDVEHSAEFTSNLLFVLMPTDYGNPDYFGLGVRTMRNMEDLHMQFPEVTRWTMVDPTSTRNARHFRSYLIGGEAAPTSASPFNLDMPINMKAIVPGLTVLDYNGSTELGRVFEEYAWAWQAVSMSQDSGKPPGFFPGAVQVGADGEVYAFGVGSGWWSAPDGYPAFPGAYATDVYLNMVAASRRQTSDPDRIELLDPLATAVLFVANNPGDVDAAPGTNSWVSFKARLPVANAAWFAKKDLLEQHPLFNDLTNPNYQANRDALEDVINSFAAPTPRFLNQSDTGTTDKSDIATTFELARKWLAQYWPFATTAVNHVDRVIVSIPAHNALTSTPSGGIYGLAPTYAVNWFNPHSDSTTTPSEELDCAILVNHLTPTSLDVLLYNAKTQPQEIGMRAWRFLEQHKYRVRIGKKQINEDEWDGAATVLPDFDFDRPGKKYVFELPSGMHLLRFDEPMTLTALNPSFDLALGRHGLAWEDNSKASTSTQDRLHVTVTNLGRIGYVVGPGARVWVTVGSDPAVQHDLIPSLEGIDNSTPPLTPQTYDIDPFVLPWGVNEDTEVTVEIRFVGTAPDQLSTDNDKVTVRLRDLEKL